MSRYLDVASKFMRTIVSLFTLNETMNSVIRFAVILIACANAIEPSGSSFPSLAPSSVPSSNQGGQLAPSGSSLPSLQPSNLPSRIPSSIPSGLPSQVPSSVPSTLPSSLPSTVPSSLPSVEPSSSVSIEPGVARAVGDSSNALTAKLGLMAVIASGVVSLFL
jgi:hypothetical protein